MLRSNTLAASCRPQQVVAWLLVALPAVTMAASVTDAKNIADLANNLTDQFTAVGKLMIGTAYVAGIGFGISSVFKFKQHKDNPTQVPIGTPFALLAVSVLLVFLPGIYAPAGESIFGPSSSKEVAGGFTGAGVSGLPSSDTSSTQSS